MTATPDTDRFDGAGRRGPEGQQLNGGIDEGEEQRRQRKGQDDVSRSR